jgi:hypothetical protein
MIHLNGVRGAPAALTGNRRDIDQCDPWCWYAEGELGAAGRLRRKMAFDSGPPLSDLGLI